jgi:Amt family ammonium transporter
MAYAFVVTFVIAKVVDKVMGLRVSEEEEYVGLDIAQHGESISA